MPKPVCMGICVACFIVFLGPAARTQAAQQFTYIEVRHNATRLTAKSCSATILSGKTPPPGRALEHRPLLISVNQFNSEVDLLLARFLEAFAVVDYFVVIEAPFTYTGKPKTLHFQEALCSKFGTFASKLVHVVDVEDTVTETGEDAPWHREFRSRLVFHLVARALDLQPDDMIFQSDTDELPTAAALKTASNLLINGVAKEGVAIPVVDLRMQAYSFSLSHRVVSPEVNAIGKPCCRILTDRAKMFKLAAEQTCTVQAIRSNWKTDSCPQAQNLVSLEGAGIHASYLFPLAGILAKQKSYAHSEFANVSMASIQELIRAERDPQGFSLERNDAAKDINLMRFRPATRQHLLQLSERLDKSHGVL